MEVYLEAGARRTFACAVEWPGWCRAGRDEGTAIDALIAYRERYAEALGKAGARLPKRATTADLHVVDRLKGGSGTDFGVPGTVPGLDAGPLAEADLARLLEIHAACWQAFERIARTAAGHKLAPAGPRGGGRPLGKIEDHVAEAEAAYVSAVGGARPRSSQPHDLRDAFVAAVRERNAGRLPDVGPRGGKRWPARYAVRRACWHLLDHAWEIEDRLSG